MRTLSVFVAGAKNLQPLRLRLKALANDLNNEYKRNGWDIAVNMVSYENFGDEQKIYNKFIAEEADLILFLLEDRIGPKTEEEYRLAVEMQKKNGHPEHCVFLNEFDARTDEIDHIEELMSATSNKYYVSYKNPEDLLFKAKTRITELALKKRKSIVIKRTKKRPLKQILLFLCLLLALAAAFRLAIGSPKSSYVYFEMPGFPKSLEQYGMNEKYFEQQLLHAQQEEALNAQDKINRMLNSTTTPPDWSINFPATIKAGRFSQIGASLRSMLGCQDLKASLHLIESTDGITSNLFITDWNGKEYKNTAEISTEALKNFDKASSPLILKNAAYLSFPHSPIVSALYDYRIVDELLDYQMVSPWQNEIYTPLEREAFLLEHANSGSPDAKMAYLLLGNYYEYQGIENGYDKTALTKAIDYYAQLMNDDAIEGFVKDKTDILNTYLTTKPASEETLVDILEAKGAFQTQDCEQLIIITDEESLVIESKQFYKATLYSFEKNADDQWGEAFVPCKVNLSSKGFALPNDKVEGDKKTPTGYYPITFAFGKKNDLTTRLDFIEIGKNHIWISDTTSNEYNTIVNDIDGKYSSNTVNEKLFRNDDLYDYAIVIDYNVNPIVKGKGSAIFMHIQRNENHRTAGCISLSREDIVQLIEWLDPAKHPHIYLCKQMPLD